MSTGELAVKLGLPTFTHAPIPKLGLYKDPVLNPLSPNWVIAFYSALSHMTNTGYRLGSWWLAASYSPSTIAYPKMSTGLKDR